MKNKKKKSLLLCLIVFFAFSNIIFNNLNFNYIETNERREINNINKDQVENKLKTSQSWEIGPILIDELTSQNWAYINNTNLWCNGKGTQSEPYIIENVTINAGGFDDGIFINNSHNIYFTLKNCTIFNALSGIKLRNSENGTLIRNNCSNNILYGIEISDCNKIKVLENNIDNNDLTGIDVYNSNYTLISGNNVTNSGDLSFDGISLLKCHHNIISNNLLINNSAGISLSGGVNNNNHNNTIFENIAINNNYFGIIVSSCYNNTITRNNATGNNNGISIQKSYNNIISKNNVSYNGFSGIFIYKSNETYISENHANFNNQTGIFLWNNSIHNEINSNIVANNDENGILLLNCNNNTFIRNNITKNILNGINLQNSHWNNISGNNIKYNNLDGIKLQQSNNNTISKNNINYNLYGIELNYSSYNYISFNTLFGNIFCIIEQDECYGNIFINNDCSKLLPAGDGDNGDKNIKTEFDLLFFLIFIIIFGSVGIVSGFSINRSRKKSRKARSRSLQKKKLETKSKMDNYKEIYKKELDLIETDKITTLEVKPEDSIKVKAELAPIPKELTLDERQKIEDEIKKTKKELVIQEREDLCQIHKGPLSGVSYICPTCKTKYCLKCARALKEKNERCWVCDNIIDISEFEKEELETPSIEKEEIHDLKEHVKTETLLEILETKNALEKPELFSNLNITAITNEFWDKINKLNLEEEDRIEFIKDMLSFTPQEREEIIDEMLRLNELNSEVSNQ